jgi:hypothetical protein
MKISMIPNMPDNGELVLFGDNQEGNIATAHSKYEAVIAHICEKKNRFGIHMGDTHEAFWLDDKRYDPATCKSPPTEQRKQVVAQLAPLAKTGRLLTVLEGNHERSLSLRLSRLLGHGKEADINDLVCQELRKVSKGIYPLTGTFSNKLEFYGKDGKLMFKGYFTHGHKAISSISPDPHRKKANMQYRLKLILQDLAGDCILMAMGDRHIVLVTPPLPAVYLTSEKGRLKQHYTQAGTGRSGEYIPPDHRFYGCTGSFLKSLVEDATTYSERAQYSPTELGYLKAIIEGGKVVELKEVKI